MRDFGVFEIITAKSTASPGWAYVPDNGPTTPLTAAQPISRKRARNPILSISSGNGAKLGTKLLRELTSLDRENHRDVSIPIPSRPHSEQTSRGTYGKVTPAVRKILQSNKSFANYLADSEAQAAPSSYVSTPIQPSTPLSRNVTTMPTSLLRHSLKKKDGSNRTIRSSRKSSLGPTINHFELKTESAEEKTSTSNFFPTFSMGTATAPLSHLRDNDPLLASWIPKIPSQDELEKLLAHPPLSYLEAKGPLVPEDQRKPARCFCERCGYWGRVKCVQCGARACALECYNEHKDICLKYGP